MKKRVLSFILCLITCLTLTAAQAESPAPISEARQRVVDYARQIYEYTWELPEEEGVLLLYNMNYMPETSGFRIVFTAWQPFVAYGTLRGVPYSLSSYGNGKETTFAEYRELTTAQRIELANIYQYASYGERVSTKYGMSCATFLTECMQQGYTEDQPPVLHGVKTFLSDPRWKRHFTFGKRGAGDYPAMQPGDFLRRDGHVMLVIENDPEGKRMRVMNQTPPDYAVENCANLTDVTVTLVYRGKPTTVQAKRLCMACDACLQATTGTQCAWHSYDELLEGEYMAVFMDY